MAHVPNKRAQKSRLVRIASRNFSRPKIRSVDFDKSHSASSNSKINMPIKFGGLFKSRVAQLRTICRENQTRTRQVWQVDSSSLLATPLSSSIVSRSLTKKSRLVANLPRVWKISVCKCIGTQLRSQLFICFNYDFAHNFCLCHLRKDT